MQIKMDFLCQISVEKCTADEKIHSFFVHALAVQTERANTHFLHF